MITIYTPSHWDGGFVNGGVTGGDTFTIEFDGGVIATQAEYYFSTHFAPNHSHKNALQRTATEWLHDIHSAARLGKIGRERYREYSGRFAVWYEIRMESFPAGEIGQWLRLVQKQAEFEQLPEIVPARRWFLGSLVVRCSPTHGTAHCRLKSSASGY